MIIDIIDPLTRAANYLFNNNVVQMFHVEFAGFVRLEVWRIFDAHSDLKSNVSFQVSTPFQQAFIM